MKIFSIFLNKNSIEFIYCEFKKNLFYYNLYWLHSRIRKGKGQTLTRSGLVKKRNNCSENNEIVRILSF